MYVCNSYCITESNWISDPISELKYKFSNIKSDKTDNNFY